MITREQLSSTRGLTGLTQLFTALGYPLKLRRVEPEPWAAAGIRVPTGSELYHASSVGPVDLFLLDADPGAARDGCAEFLASLRKWNVLAKPVIACADRSSIALHGFDRNGRLRRLEASTSRASADVLDRLNLLARREGDSDLEVSSQFERALERESMTRQFFERFRVAVDKVAIELSAQCQAPSETVRDEALLLLSRCLFLYFLQQKGWLDGNQRFIFDHLRAALLEDRSFFDLVLRPLFFGCLNTPVTQRDQSSRPLGRIPYLNGGLFEPSPFEQSHLSFTLSNPLLEEVIENVFERYSFCVDEGDEEGVHIDPEMLGKVFESLMAEEERLATGSFYTPKPVVDGLAEQAITRWCKGDDPAVMLQQLRSIRVIDPACGSGAFLLAALHVIERLTRQHSLAAGQPVEPNLRQKIVERSLFGVDVKPEAVRLCELRLWLSIVSAADASQDEVEPLPNLDRNILQGNTLLGPLDFLAGSDRAEVYRRWAYALQARRGLFERYRHALPAERPALCRAIRESDQSLAMALLGSALKTDREELERISEPCHGLFGPMRNPDEPLRPALESRIAETERHLARVQEGRIDFFAFDLHFAQVFADGGFDVVLGNPPWVRRSRIDPAMRRMLSERYALFRSGRGFDQSDLCLAFWQKAFEIAGEGGVVAMLMPAKVATANYGAALRKKIIDSSELVAISDWTGRDLFDADTFPLALIVRKARPSARTRVSVVTGGSTFSISQNRLSSRQSGSPWRLLSPRVLEVVERIQNRFPTVEESLQRRPVMGLKTGANDRFFVNDLEFRNGSARVPSLDLGVPIAAVARCVRGRDVERWKVSGATWMLLPPRENGSKMPAWVSRAAAALRIEPSEFRLAYVQPEHFGVKVIWKDVSRGLQAVVLPAATRVCGREFPMLPNQTLYLLEALGTQEAHVLAAVMNSTVFGALALAVADRAKDFHYRYFGSTISGVAVPRLRHDSEQVRLLGNLSRRAHRGHDVRGEIDESVRRLYRISRKDFEVLSEFLADRLGL